MMIAYSPMETLCKDIILIDDVISYLIDEFLLEREKDIVGLLIYKFNVLMIRELLP